MRNIVYQVNKVCIMVTSTFLIAIVLLTTASVGRRYLFGSEIIAVLNIDEFLLVAVTFIGLAWTQLRQGHIATDFLYVRMKERSQLVTSIATAVISIFFASLITAAGWSMALESLRTGESAFSTGAMVPLWPARFIIPIGAGLYVVSLLFNLGDAVAGLVRRKG